MFETNIRPGETYLPSVSGSGSRRTKHHMRNQQAIETRITRANHARAVDAHAQMLILSCRNF